MLVDVRDGLFVFGFGVVSVADAAVAHVVLEVGMGPSVSGGYVVGWVEGRGRASCEWATFEDGGLWLFVLVDGMWGDEGFSRQ